MARLDLSQWVLHFIHRRKPEDTLDDLEEVARLEGYSGEVRLPDFYNENGEGVNLLSEYDEKEYVIADDADSIDVLKKILHDGFIHSSWSLRNMNPTIYGPRTAVCFTEMPLYALSDYVKERGKSGYVGNVAIAFKRNELFEAGARHVIYGISGIHKEKDYTEVNIYHGRELDESCGIGLNEQYRYVATSLTSNPNHKSIDWTHEREWRWPLPYSELNIPGLPFILEDYPSWFSEILIIVETLDQKNDILEYLKSLHDSEGNNIGFCYDKSKIDRVMVVSLDEINGCCSSLMCRIEDINQSSKAGYPRIIVSNNIKNQVGLAIAEAQKIAKEKLDQYISVNPNYNSNNNPAGFAWVCTSTISEVTEALVIMKKANTFADGIYQLDLNLGYPYNDDIFLAKLMADAAAQYLTKIFGQDFFVRTRLD